MSIHEPIQDTVDTTPLGAVVGGATPRPGRSRVRWLVAAGVTGAVVVLATAATLLLTGASGDPDVLAWVPADSVAYAEVRLDLPGDQATALAKAMSAFPGFADQAAFPTKLGEALDSLVKQGTSDKQGYLADIAPWFGGQLSVSVGPLPATADSAAARMLLLASVKDGPKAAAWAAAALEETGATSSTETYSGVTITIVSPPASAATGAAMMKAKPAWASLGPVIALGDLASVKAAIDTGGKRGLGSNAQFRTAAATIAGDRLAFGYVDVTALASGAKGLAGTAAASAMPKLPAMLTDAAGPWAAMALRAQDGGFVLQTRTPHVALPGPGAAGAPALPGVVPAGTVALVEGRSVGQTLQRLKAAAAADPSLAAGVKQLDSTIAVVGGGFAGIVDWMGEAAVVITRDGASVSGGLVVVPTDRAAADRLFAQLKAVIALAGLSSGSSPVKDEAYGGATITTIDVSSLGPLLSGLMGGATGSLPGASPGAAIPSLPANLSISYTVTDGVVVLAPDAGFVKAVLDARTGPTLASSDRFKAALAAAGPVSGSLLWLDVASMRDLLEAQVPNTDRSAYTADLKPYLDAFDSVIGTYSPGDKVDSGTLDIRLRKP
jgi:hypothetical protein